MFSNGLMRGWNEVQQEIDARPGLGAGIRMRGTAWQFHARRRRIEPDAERRQPPGEGSGRPARHAAFRTDTAACRAVRGRPAIPAGGAQASAANRRNDAAGDVVGRRAAQPQHRHRCRPSAAAGSAPRLPDFLRLHPGTVLNVASRSAPFDFEEQSFDLAIHYGQPVWAHGICTYLCSEIDPAGGEPARWPWPPRSNALGLAGNNPCSISQRARNSGRTGSSALDWPATRPIGAIASTSSR